MEGIRFRVSILLAFFLSETASPPPRICERNVRNAGPRSRRKADTVPPYQKKPFSRPLPETKWSGLSYPLRSMKGNGESMKNCHPCAYNISQVELPFTPVFSFWPFVCAFIDFNLPYMPEPDGWIAVHFSPCLVNTPAKRQVFADPHQWRERCAVLFLHPF